MDLFETRVSSAVRAHAHPCRLFASMVLLLACGLLACGRGHEPAAAEKAGGGEPIAECDEYATQYEASLSAGGAPDQEFARRRADATRNALAMAARKETGRDELRKTCAAGLARLRGSGPAASVLPAPSHP